MSTTKPSSLLAAPLLLAAAVLAACGSSAPTVDCSATPPKGYAQLTDVMAQCTGCHGATGARDGVRFDTYDEAVKNASRGADEIASGSMPPGGGMSDAQKEAFYAWAQCGTPK